MRRLSTLALTLTLAGALFAGCSDATGPAKARALGRRLEALKAQACTANPNSSRCTLLTYALAAVSSGAAPSTVPVMTVSGVQQWQGLVVLFGDSTTPDEQFWLMLYSDTNATNAVLGLIRPFVPAAPQAWFGVADSIVAALSVHGFSIMPTEVGTACRSVAGLHSPYPSSQCRLATFNVSLHATSTAYPSVDPALESIIIGPQIINGIRVLP